MNDDNLLLSVNEILLSVLCDTIGLKGVYKENEYGVSIYSLFYDGKELPWDEYVDYVFKEPLVTSNNTIIGALVFGDGTMEFLLKDVDEPVSWCDLIASDLDCILDYLEKN